jgi:hypothetical protein
LVAFGYDRIADGQTRLIRVDFRFDILACMSEDFTFVVTDIPREVEGTDNVNRSDTVKLAIL